MSRYRARAVQGLHARQAHVEHMIEYRPPAITTAAPPDRVTLLARKVQLEEAAGDLALRISVWPDPKAVAAFEQVRTELAVIETGPN